MDIQIYTEPFETIPTHRVLVYFLREVQLTADMSATPNNSIGVKSAKTRQKYTGKIGLYIFFHFLYDGRGNGSYLGI